MKRFILGVGAQKAGTTWLHDYLVSRDNVNMGFVKEYHIFDTKTLEECAGYMRKLEQAAVRRAQYDFDRWRKNVNIRRLEFIEHPERYFDYFAKILSQDGVSYTGDITPSYSGLKPETLEYIRDEFSKRNIEVYPIFLMRDPVQRLRSSMKMRFRKKDKTVRPRQEVAAMRKRCGEKGDRIRSDYRATIENLDAVFGQRVYYGLYEDLFRDQSVFAVCDYLGMKRKPGVYNIRKNASPSENKISKKVMQSFVEHYEDQYKFCRERFGAAKIDSLWQKF